MYVPSTFKPADLDTMYDLIERSPLGALVSVGETGLAANHIPFELDRAAGVLRAHVARKNPVWQEAAAGRAEALVIFTGPDAYISPSWYATKAETHEVVPTWNYVAVHVRGTINVIDDVNWLRGLVARLTRRFEANQSAPWKMSDAPAPFIAEELRHIVGIEIPVAGIEGKWKLGQNRTRADREGMKAGLGAVPDARSHALAQAIDAVAEPKRED
jgi:transcriptional regulator